MKSKTETRDSWLSRFMADYGMIFVLLVLMAILSVATLDVQQPTGDAAGENIAQTINQMGKPKRVLVVTPDGWLDRMIAEGISANLNPEHSIIATIHGGPRDARLAIEQADSENRTVDVIACSAASSKWDPVQSSGAEILTPTSYNWPDFLMPDNLVTIAQRITIIAIIAIGMTMVIITAGIDLSVGSLIALSAVVTAVLIRESGGKDATTLMLWICAIGGILACGGVGFFTGFLVAGFRLPPFIVTLAMMLLVRGVANVISEQETIHEIPVAFDALGKGYLFGIPYSVWLMFALFAIAWFVMSRTTLGRQIYAVGGNEEAARLAGIRVKRIILIVYTVCGLLSGLGGVIVCSQLRSAKASYGMMDELTVIAAVVVGGTSLMGGQGKVLGTLIGAFIIGVIQNGMNLVHMDDKTQMIVLGSVIVLAVLLDRIKKGQVKWSDVSRVFSE
ncbi:MAG: ABC transporter permease [Planctomycetota bacterium]